MMISGEFTARATVGELRSLSGSADVLASVSTLSEIRPVEGMIRAVFSPTTALGRIPLRTTIETLVDTDAGARLRVRGSRAGHGVDVDLHLAFSPVPIGTVVSWTADLVVRGNAASVGQRVAGSVASHAIQDVLEQAASAAHGREVQA
ncbi:SRPBCC domain-containing protein [Aeromicrobium fastidiosum]|uniref:DUF2505 domain-containing protein n=1 Tax=Aeromicrobium fastidiosum TaxID=52699 RepID=A0A641ALI2_9ACTN|nr:SRPBCC domain-containing protein [Aeromicrobium fastidiosum]KAA1378148.1 hypothetical protein ESP62_007130 [Aeromicrobium fastidiosum]MBP2389050.1 carbon monoxide dehydrogenase subunit G [Aeromicrobium fastidiosum]